MLRMAAFLFCGVIVGPLAYGQQAEPKLLPQPREIHWSKRLALDGGMRVVSGADAEDRFAAVDLRAALRARGVRVDAPGKGAVMVELLRARSARALQLLLAEHARLEEAMRAEGYVLVPTQRGMAVIADGAAGVFYGAQTVKQLVVPAGFLMLGGLRGGRKGKALELATAVVRDWPAMQYRGMDDDLSRGPVPTLEFQKKQVRTFAAYKLNVYSPYFENTFVYKSHPLGASPGGAMTQAEYVELCRYAALYHMTVVPEQEAFGHLHNLLSYEEYAPLAETPHGSVLAPGDVGVLPLIQQWFTELAAVTPGPFLHLGGDETFDLGKGRTRAEVEKRGLGAVYIDFLKRVDEAVRPLGKRILFWGDVAMNEPKLVPLLPKDMVAVPWNYDLSPDGYERFIAPFKEAGLETWVASGVNNWNRVYPDSNVALKNMQGFIRDGQRMGSTGALTVAWNDDGEGLFNEDWYGVLFAAGASWQRGESSIEIYQASYGEVFHGDATGQIDQAQRELMAAHALLGQFDDRGASDVLFWMDPWSADGRATAPKMRPVVHEVRMHAERALDLIAHAQEAGELREQDAVEALALGARRMDVIGMKFELADEMVEAYGRAYALARVGGKGLDVDSELYAISDTNGRCQDIRNGYSLTRDLFEEAWGRENRPFSLRNVLARYDLAIGLWTQRGDAVAAALHQWHREHTLPAPEALEIPAGEK